MERECEQCSASDPKGDDWLWFSDDLELDEFGSDLTVDYDVVEDARPFCSHECFLEYEETVGV